MSEERDVSQALDDAAAWMEKEPWMDADFAFGVAMDHRCLFCDSRRCWGECEDEKEGS